MISRTVLSRAFHYLSLSYKHPLNRQFCRTNQFWKLSESSSEYAPLSCRSSNHNQAEYSCLSTAFLPLLDLPQAPPDGLEDYLTLMSNRKLDWGILLFWEEVEGGALTDPLSHITFKELGWGLNYPFL